MIYGKRVCHKTLVRYLLPWEDYSREPKENHDARYDNQHLKMEYLEVHSSCKFPVVVLQENVPVSILPQADEVRLKKLMRKPDREKQSIQSKL